MYTLESRVRYSECDENGRLTPLAMTNYLQDCSIFHAEDIGRGVDVMREHGIAWLLAAWQIEIRRLPLFDERISVNTWCHDIGRSLASRNFTICDDRGEQLVRAEALWFVYDFKAGRAIRIPEFLHVFQSELPALDMPKTERRLPVEGDFVEAPAITVAEMHLDTNRHVNNAQYLAMAIDTLVALRGDKEDAEKPQAQRICAQYKLQARLGDIIVPRVHADGSTYTVDLASPEGDTYAIVRVETA